MNEFKEAIDYEIRKFLTMHTKSTECSMFKPKDLTYEDLKSFVFDILCACNYIK